eukprot:GHVQ01035222.1.p2 GENE.GHVQ01035222.1~~GHVQ01035222.1.p2  ORF type:complete len:118 (-),score=9.27 GHVQ01035222.1:284-637(-)
MVYDTSHGMPVVLLFDFVCLSYLIVFYRYLSLPSTLPYGAIFCALNRCLTMGPPCSLVFSTICWVCVLPSGSGYCSFQSSLYSTPAFSSYWADRLGELALGWRYVSERVLSPFIGVG